MTSIRLWIPEPPTTWKRACGGKFKYTDPAQESAQNAVRLAWYEKGRVRLRGPLFLLVRVYLPRQKKDCPVTPVGARTGDVDNYLKLVADALQDRPKKGETWCYANDCEILGGVALKFWATPTPGTEILLVELDPCDWWVTGEGPIERCLETLVEEIKSA